jgi:hypothetical protein
MSDEHKEMFAAHAAEIEQARQYAESAAREHDEAREALEALRAECIATIDALDVLAPEMTAAQLAGNDEAIASLRDTFKRLTVRREQLAGELHEAETRLETLTPGHLAYQRAQNSASVTMTAAARLRDETIRQIENAYRERVDGAMCKLREESSLAHEDWREGQRIAREAGWEGYR